MPADPPAIGFSETHPSWSQEGPTYQPRHAAEDQPAAEDPDVEASSGPSPGPGGDPVGPGTIVMGSQKDGPRLGPHPQPDPRKRKGFGS